MNLARNVLLPLLAALVVAACEPAPEPAAADAPVVPAPPASPLAQGDNAFEVAVTLSETAARTLAASGESVIVAADYFGYPSVAAQQRQAPGTEDPWLTLHQHEIELDGAGTAAFPAVVLDPQRLQLVERGQPQLLINVYSGRKSSEDNLLDCGTFQDTLATAVRGSVEIDCKLIAE